MKERGIGTGAGYSNGINSGGGKSEGRLDDTQRVGRKRSCFFDSVPDPVDEGTAVTEEERDVRADGAGESLELGGGERSVVPAVEEPEDSGGITTAAAEPCTYGDLFVDMDMEGGRWEDSTEETEGFYGEVGSIGGDHGICAGEPVPYCWKQGNGVDEINRLEEAADLVEAIVPSAEDA